VTPPHTDTRPVVVGVDLGKTGCRAALVRLDETAPVLLAEHAGPGFGGLAEPDGVADAVRAVVGTVTAARAAAGSAAAQPERVVVGAAGAEAAPESAAALAQRLAEALGTSGAGVTSDSVTGHAGALRGAPGVVTAVGTGAVSLGLGADGSLHRVDGWGQWLGDDGSGAWIGRAALRAVVRAVDGRGPGTTLVAAAELRFGTVGLLPAVLPLDPALPRRTASFVPDVLAAARAGDEVASGLLEQAADLWVESTLAAADAVRSPGTVALIGGLAAVPELADRWLAGLDGRLAVARDPGSGLDGAVLLASRTDLPHERSVTRCGRATSHHDSQEPA
jgi:N-acetylglucosamine kinase-like BadF-type ATPase